MKKRIY
ncbi:hypothetical protein CJF31_00010799 [Rutstroemia sp. NJR-2017a BVV2]|nr:hypothetical protein CJF31_00010799 [Rutstroemia sp. NJR-2017a BVV2]PQE13435.1 hypothetical protein CJF32_00005323 [Rutstroemia sp. NJR-2017a WRK4]PQE24590.1 hypothetical protein CJF32_00007616 [Rutstroemia sp. NJR-2017a WRK4]